MCVVGVGGRWECWEGVQGRGRGRGVERERGGGRVQGDGGKMVENLNDI